MHWYLIFCDNSKPQGQRWLGACYVEGSDMLTAILNAWDIGCNPGGEAIGVQVPDHVSVQPSFMNRLLTRPELERAVGDAPGSSRTLAEQEEREELGEFGPAKTNPSASQ